MANIICLLECTWDREGNVKSTILFGANKDEQTNILKVFAPSVSMLTCHQLGVFTPTNGLSLTKQFIDYILKEKSALAPIDTVLQNTRIEVVFERGSARMLYHPKTTFMANSQKVEYASRQFLYNYSMHVFGMQPYYTLVSIKIYLGLALREYLDLLTRQILSSQLSPSVLAWNSEIQLHMVGTAINMNKGFGLSTAESYNPESEKNVIGLFQELEHKHNDICKKLEL